MEGIDKDIASLAKSGIRATHAAVFLVGYRTEDAVDAHFRENEEPAWARGLRWAESKEKIHSVSLNDVLRRVYIAAPPPLGAPGTRLPRRRARGGNTTNRPLCFVSQVFGAKPGTWAARMRVYGRDAAEAQRLVSAVVDHCAKQATIELDHFKRTRVKVSDELVGARENLRQLEEERSQLVSELERHPSNPEVAHLLALDFDKQLRLLNIEIAGLRAQIERAKEATTIARARSQQSPGTAATTISVMSELVEKLSVDLAGALARKGAISTELTAAKREVHRKDVQRRVDRAKSTVTALERHVEQHEELATTRSAYFEPPVVVDDLVSILSLEPE